MASDLEAKAREIAGLLKGDVAPNFRDQFVQRCQELALSALREERERAAKIAESNKPEAAPADWNWQGGYETACATIAAAIRGDSNG